MRIIHLIAGLAVAAAGAVVLSQPKPQPRRRARAGQNARRPASGRTSPYIELDDGPPERGDQTY